MSDHLPSRAWLERRAQEDGPVPVHRDGHHYLVEVERIDTANGASTGYRGV